MSEYLAGMAAVCRIQIRKYTRDGRWWLVLVLFLLYFVAGTTGIRDFCATTGTRVTPFLFPFLTSDWVCQILISGGFLWLAMSMGTSGQEDYFARFRSGNRVWDAGSCLSVICMAFLYTAGLALLSVLVLIPRILFADKWGEVWKTLAMTDATQFYDIEFEITSRIVRLFEPSQAFLLSFLLQVLCLVWLGLLMYFVNKATGGTAGFYLSLSLVLLDTMLYNCILDRFYSISPVSLVQLGRYSNDMLRYGVTLRHSIYFYAVGIAAFFAAAVAIPQRAK